MFKYWSLKKYDNKLLPYLEKNFGKQEFYSASQIRKIVYRKDFNPHYLPLAYILFLDPIELDEVIAIEFPQLELEAYKKEILMYLDKKGYQGFLQSIQQVAA